MTKLLTTEVKSWLFHRVTIVQVWSVFTSIFPSHVQYRDQFESIRFGELTIQVDCLCLQITLENSLLKRLQLLS